ncbi:RidA family protein [Fictibacillus sp. BK138]|uniref:RidA family protein n=1 Tax=Fictibacillus sp. BK138 TaxID=2512121 RepID=UPI0010296E92|nr:RidA family protein [Fictibacillus sp. BK138]RZT15481.1 enamine deaminase RidA (YjgF/YER057c/UK114 family) [Fictibacillus sp. BK138]
MKIRKTNPDTVSPPIAQYHHVTIIPREAELVVLSGQIGNDKDGILPKDIESQFANALDNIKAILNSERVSTNNIFKINFWLTEEIDRKVFLDKWEDFHKGNPPVTTFAYITALAKPELKVEIEAWAAK